jgi:hypothetical protein
MGVTVRKGPAPDEKPEPPKPKTKVQEAVESVLGVDLEDSHKSGHLVTALQLEQILEALTNPQPKNQLSLGYEETE